MKPRSCVLLSLIAVCAELTGILGILVSSLILYVYHDVWKGCTADHWMTLA